MSVAVGDEPLNEAVTVAVAVVGTIPVVTVKVAVVLPEDTTTLAGTVAAVVPETESVTVSLADAALESVTVPVAVLPPSTVVGVKLTVAVIGVTVSCAVAGVPVPTTAEIVETNCAETSWVVTANMAVD